MLRNGSLRMWIPCPRFDLEIHMPANLFPLPWARTGVLILPMPISKCCNMPSNLSTHGRSRKSCIMMKTLISLNHYYHPLTESQRARLADIDKHTFRGNQSVTANLQEATTQSEAAAKKVQICTLIILVRFQFLSLFSISNFNIHKVHDIHVPHPCGVVWG